jgi:hypothetical protein
MDTPSESAVAQSFYNGWIKVHRSLLDHPRKRDPDWVALWVHLMLSATHKDIRRTFDDHEIVIRPGQLITSRKSLSFESGVNESKVERVLGWMTSEHLIEQQSDRRSRLITITCWHDCQGDEQLFDGDRTAFEQRSNSVRTASESNSDTHKKEEEEGISKKKNKEGKNEEGGGPPASLPEEALIWNSHQELPKVVAFGRGRRTHLAARRQEQCFVENFAAAVARVAVSDFCLGKNARGWKATIDWMLQDGVCAKIMEGNYDNRPSVTNGHANGHKPVGRFDTTGLTNGRDVMGDLFRAKMNERQKGPTI